MRVVHSGMTTKLAMMAALVATTMGLSGCGGGGGGGGSTTSTSPFAGTYSGQFDFSGSTNQSGEISFTVDSSGKVAGNVHNDTYDLTGTVSGTIDSSGNSNLTYNYPTNGVYTSTGKLAASANNYLSGQVEEFSGSTDIGPLDISVKKQ